MGTGEGEGDGVCDEECDETRVDFISRLFRIENLKVSNYVLCRSFSHLDA